MAKVPVAKANAPVVQGRSPFMPPVFVQQPPANLGTSTPQLKANPYTGVFEDGCHAYLNYDAVSIIAYNGQNQTKTINQTFRP